MNKLNKEYIDLKEYIKYLQQETGIIKEDFTATSYKIRKKSEKSNGKEIIIDKGIIYLNKRWVSESIELFKNSVVIIEAIKIIEEYKYMKIEYINRQAIEPKCQVYKIPLIDERNCYISKQDLNRILEGIKEVHAKECINGKELLSKMKKLFKGFTFSQSSKLIFVFIRDNNLEVIRKENIGNFMTPIRDLYPKATVDKVIENAKNLCESYLVKTINMSFDEYYNLSKEEFNKGYKKLTTIEFNNISGYDDLKIKLEKFKVFFKGTKVKCIYIYKRGMYVSVNEYNELLDFKNNYVNINHLKENKGDSKRNLSIVNVYKEKLKLEEKRINIHNEEYILLKEYIHYLYEETGIDMELGRVNPKFKKMYKENIEEKNVILYEGSIYLRKKWVSESIELFKRSINVNDAVKIIEKYKDLRIEYVNRQSLETKCQVYKIPLINRNYIYISKNDFKRIIDGIKEVYDKECINGNELLEMFNCKFKGITFGSTSKLIFKFIRNNNLEVIRRNYIGNFITPIMDLYPKITVDKVIENVEARCEEYVVRLINLSFKEYYNLPVKEFKSQYKELTTIEFNEISGYKDVNTKFRNCKRIFNDTKVKCIWIHQGSIYVSIKEYEEFLEFKNNYVNINHLRESGIEVKGFVKILKNNNFEIINYKQKTYMRKDEVPRFMKIRGYLSEMDNANTVLDKFMVKFNYFDDEKKNQFVKFNGLYTRFVRAISATNKSLSVYSRLFNTYKLLLGCLEKDLTPERKEENNKFFKKALFLSGNSINNRAGVIKFSNYLIKNKRFDINKLSDIKEKVPLPVYEEEEFINLLIKLIDIIADKENIKKLYRNWNISSVVTYIFMHYSLAWRKMDLVNQLYAPILQNIKGVTDGESFIKWLEDGNVITDRMANDICEELEKKTERLNLKASKNNQELSCVISSSLSKEVALLLCISEANRQIHANNIRRTRKYPGLFNPSFLEPKEIQKVMKENFDIDINVVLDGGFDNRRMNKSFLTLVKEKAEELNLAYAYYYAQVSRGHKATLGQLAETTKIYLKKDISKAALMAFSMGTMGSVVHIILQLVSSDYKDKSLQEQIEVNNSLGLTPYAIERNVEKITNKISIMKNEIEMYFQSGGQKEDFLKKLLYGQNFYGSNEKTKCLLKIIQKDKRGIKRIECTNYKKNSTKIIECPKRRESCIGCDYMIALRYFIYEFERRFEDILDKLENCEHDLDRRIVIYSINNNYIPLINDLAMVLGEEVKSVIDTERFIALTREYGGE